MWGSLISAGAGLLGAIGKSKDKPASEQSGYSAAPANVKKTLEGPYWDYATQTFNDLVNRPMARVDPYTPDQMFGSPELSAIQQAADMRAGLIPQQDLVYNNGMLQPISQPAPLPGQMPAAQAQAPTALPGMQQTGPANKSNGMYYNPEESLRLLSQGISTPSLAAYLAQLGVK